MKALITGANGFLGRAVVAAFLSRGHAVRALVRPAVVVDGLWPDPVEVVRADLRSPPPLGDAFEGVDVLVHLAADVTGSDEDQFATTVVGTERLLTAMAGTSGKRLVLASSFSVYDWNAARGHLDEDTPLARNLDERGGYTVAKLWQEKVARRLSAAHGFELTVLRPGFVWGRGNEWLAGIGHRFGGVLLVVADTKLPLTYVENCADCFVIAAENGAAIGGTFNVVDGDEVTAWRYAGEYLRRTGTRATAVPIPYQLGMGLARLAHGTGRRLLGPTVKLPSLLVPARFEARFKPLRFPATRVRDVIGWCPRYDFEQALTRTFGPEEPSQRAIDEVGSRSPSTPT